MKHGFPLATTGLRVGLLGGSFDPPHNGHLHISKWALRKFHLDCVWWLVSPGNPLKTQGPAPLERRMASRRYTRYRLSPKRAAALPLRASPCWTMLTGKTL